MIEKLMEGLGLRIAILQMEEQKLHGVCTVREIMKNHSYDLVAMEAKRDAYMRLFATLRDGEKGVDEANNRLKEQHDILEEELRQHEK